MRLSAPNGGQCAFCAFRASEWLIPSIRRSNAGRRYASASTFEIRRLQGRLGTTRGPSERQHASRDRSWPSAPPDDSRKSNRADRNERTRDRTPPRRPTADERRNVNRAKNPLDIRRGLKRLELGSEAAQGVFARLLMEQCDLLAKDLCGKSRYQAKSWGINYLSELEDLLSDFEKQLQHACSLAGKGHSTAAENPLFARFRKSFIDKKVAGLYLDLKFAFMDSVVGTRFSKEEKTNQLKIADLRYPIDWYPATRAMQRTIHLHVGPTNSGKTYHALQRLEAAQSGVYAGPLRLLAHEVYSRLNAKGKACALVTGEERRIPEGMEALMSSCTVEMVPLNAPVDVAVIDEIQMMGDQERGWAWTQAFLGVQAKEVHLCGELRTVDLVTSLTAAMGDKLVVHRYERLSPLKSMERSLRGDLSKLQKGDAVIMFSRLAIHAMKQDIEKATGKRCAVVYGSLPPETRAQQAALFNDPDNDYDFLVASDAVGMGLNLSIKRIIFEATSKHDGTSQRLIQVSEIKQIAGRAGRYKTAQDAVTSKPVEGSDGKEPFRADLVKPAAKNVGYVTTLDNFDLPIVREAMRTEAEPLKSAGIFPPSSVLLRFASYFPPKTPFSYIVLRLNDLASTSPLFHMCGLKEQTNVADLIQPYNMSAMDRIIFMSAPVALRDPGFTDVISELASCVANREGGDLLSLKSLDLELIDMDIHDHPSSTKGYLREAEALHKGLTLYLWLSYRFAGVFQSQAVAFHAKTLVEAKIDECLNEVSWEPGTREMRARQRKKALEEASELDLVIDDTVNENISDIDTEQGHAQEGRSGTGNDGVEMIEAQDVSGSLEASEETLVDAESSMPSEIDEALSGLKESEDSPAAAANVPTPPPSEDTKASTASI